MRSYITLGLFIARASCNQGSDLLYAETRSGPRESEKTFTPQQGLVYEGSTEDLLYAETKSDAASGEKVLKPEMDKVYEESPRFLQELYEETNNAPADGEDKTLADLKEPVYDEVYEGSDDFMMEGSADSATKVASGIVSLTAIIFLIQ